MNVQNNTTFRFIKVNITDGSRINKDNEWQVGWLLNQSTSDLPTNSDELIALWNDRVNGHSQQANMRFTPGEDFNWTNSSSPEDSFSWSNKMFLFGTSNSIPNDSLYSLGKADNDGSIEFKITSTSECIIGISSNNIVSSHSVQDIIDNNYYEVFGFYSGKREQTLVTNVISDYNLNNKYDISNNIKTNHKFPYTCKISWEHNGGIPKFDTPPSNIGTLSGSDSPNNPSISYIGYDSLDGKYVAGFEDTIAGDLKMVKIDSSGNTISGTGRISSSDDSSSNIINQTDLISIYNSATAITNSDGYIFNKSDNDFTNYVTPPIVRLHIDGEEKASMIPKNNTGDWYLFGHVNSLTSHPYSSGPAFYINANEKEYRKQLVSDGHNATDMITEAFDFSVPIAKENTMRGILETNA